MSPVAEVMEQPISHVTDTYACDTMGTVWLWCSGHVDKRKLKGACLSRRTYFDADIEAEQIYRGTVHHGWVITVAGDTSGCGWDESLFFEATEPQVREEEYTDPEGEVTKVRRWDGATTYGEDDEELDAEVVDGPHRATWLQLWEPPPRVPIVRPLGTG